MHTWLVLQLIVLVAPANSAPVVVNGLFGKRLSYPLDDDANFVDGQPLFGSSKTIRGILFSVMTTVAAAPLVGAGVDGRSASDSLSDIRIPIDSSIGTILIVS